MPSTGAVTRRGKRRPGAAGPLGRVWLAVSLSAFAALAVIAWLAVLATLNSATRNLDRFLVAALEDQLGRPVRIAELDVLRPGRLRAAGLEVAAGPTFEDGALMTAHEIVAQYRLWDIVRGRTDPVGSISEVIIRRPYLLIVRDAENRFNLQDLFPTERRAPTPSPFRGVVRIENGSLRFEDHAARDLPTPQANTLYGVDGVLDAGAPPLMLYSVRARGDGVRIGPVSAEGDIQSDRGAFSLRVNAGTEAAGYWARYFLDSPDIVFDAGRGSVAVDAWKPRQGDPLGATVRVSAHSGVARSRLARAPLTGIEGRLTMRFGETMETAVDLRGQSAGIPVRVFGSVFTGGEPRLALRATARNVTMPALSRILQDPPEVEWLTPLAPATVEAQIYGPIERFVAVANIQLPGVLLYDTPISNLVARVRYQDDRILIPSVAGVASGRPVTGEGEVNLRTNTLRLVANVPGVEASDLGLTDLPLSGRITSRIVVDGPTHAPRTSALITVTDGAFERAPFDRLTARIQVEGDTVTVEDAVAEVPGGALMASGTLKIGGPIDLRLQASGVRMGQLLPALGYPDVTGTAFFQGTVRGATDRPVVQGEAQIYNASIQGQRLDYAVGSFEMNPDRLRLANVALARYPAQAVVSGTADFRPDGQVSLDLLARLQSGRIEPFLRDAGLEPIAEGDIVTPEPIRISGTLEDPDVQGRLALSDATIEGYAVRTATTEFRYRDGALSLSNLVAESEFGSAASTTRLTLPELRIEGDSLAAPEPFTVSNIRLESITGLGAPYASLAGEVNITGRISGTREDPRVVADIEADGLVVNTEPFERLTASVAYGEDGVSVTDLSLRRASGEVIAVPSAVWDREEKTLAAAVRSSGLPLQLLEDLLVESDWYNYRADPGVRRTVRDLERMGVRFENATLALAGSSDGGEPSGAVDIRYGPEGVSLNGALVLRDLRMQDQNLDELSLSGAVRNLREEGGRLVAAIDIPVNGFWAESGDMTVSGHLMGAVGGDIEAQIEALNIPVSIARLFLPRPDAGDGRRSFDPADLKGDLTIVVDAGGEWDHPEVIASVSGKDMMVPGSSLPLSIRTSAIRINNDPAGSRIEIERNISLLARDHSVKITGSAPFDWKTRRIPPDRPLNLAASVDEQGLDMLSLLLGGTESGPIEAATGSLVADVQLQGTLDAPRWSGFLRVDDGAMKLRALRSTLRNINADLRLGEAGNTIEINRFEVESSDGGRVRVVDDSRIGLPGLRSGPGTLAPRIALALEGFRLVETPNAMGLGERFQATLNTPAGEPLRIVQEGGRPLTRGQIHLSDVEVVPPNQTPAANPSARPPAVVPAFDLSLVVGKNVWVRNPLFRVMLSDRGGVENRSLHVTGTLLEPRVEGTLTSREGTLVYPTARFRLTDATIRVQYPAMEGLGGAGANGMGERSAFNIVANAQTRLIAPVQGQRQPITVNIRIEGPNPSLAPGNDEGAFGSLSPYRITMKSTPSLPERQLVALITREDALQRLAEGGNPEEVLRQETMNILQASVLPEALSGFESRLGDAFGLEALSLDYTMVNSTLSVTATKRITDRVVLTYSRPIGEDAVENGYTISLNYQIQPRLQLTLQQQRGRYITGQRRTTLPGTQSGVTENLILLEGAFPF